MRAIEFISESFIFESYSLARTEFIRAATAKFGPEVVAKIGTKDEPEEVTQEINNVKQLLDQHRDLAKKNQFRNPEEKDINHWRRQGWAKFSRTITLKSSDITDSQLKRGRVDGNAIILHDDAEWKVLIPLNKESSVTSGRRTEWCTTKANQSQFEEYFYQSNIILIYAIPKDPLSNQHVAISIDPNGDVEMFNRDDDPINAQEYTQISGLDSSKFIDMASQPEIEEQVEYAREIHNTVTVTIPPLLKQTPLDLDAIERALKIARDGKYCYDYIIAYGKEQNNRVTVHPAILVDVASYIETNNTELLAKTVGQYIDFGDITSSTFKSIIRVNPDLFIYNYKLLNNNQQSMLAKTPVAAYKYAKNILKGDSFPAGEKAIASNAKYSYEYTKMIDKPFPAGEPAIATDAKYSYQYARTVLHNAFPLGEKVIHSSNYFADLYTNHIFKIYGSDTWAELFTTSPQSALDFAYTVMIRVPVVEKVIATSAEHSYGYALNVLDGKRFPAGEAAIASSPHYSWLYAIRFCGEDGFPAGEPAIAKGSNYSVDYAKLTKKPFPAGEKAIATDPVTAIQYAVEVLSGPFPEGEEMIATSMTASDTYTKLVGMNGSKSWVSRIVVDADSAYHYAFLIDKPFPKIEHLIATDGQSSYSYATRVLKDVRFLAGEPAIATNARLSFWYAQRVLKTQSVPIIEKGIATNVEFSFKYALLTKKEFPVGEPAIATTAEYACTYAIQILGRRFLLGEEAIKSQGYYARLYDQQFGTNLSQQ